MTALIRINANLGELSQAPIAASKLIKGTPTATTAHQFTNSHNNFHCGVWSSDAGAWTLSYTEDEFCFIMEGEAIITSDNGSCERLVKGDAFVLPAGFSGTWETIGSVQKFYAIYEQAD